MKINGIRCDWCGQVDCDHHPNVGAAKLVEEEVYGGDGDVRIEVTIEAGRTGAANTEQADCIYDTDLPHPACRLAVAELAIRKLRAEVGKERGPDEKAVPPPGWSHQGLVSMASDLLSDSTSDTDKAVKLAVAIIEQLHPEGAGECVDCACVVPRPLRQGLCEICYDGKHQEERERAQFSPLREGDL